MIITIRNRKYRLSPGLTVFVRGLQYGAGIGFGIFIFVSLLIAVVMATLMHA